MTALQWLWDGLRKHREDVVMSDGTKDYRTDWTELELEVRKMLKPAM
jgi:hypothetical protein